MLNIRPATEKDYDQILKILKELDLFYPALVLKGFWVAEEDKKIISTVQLEEHPDFVYLGSLAVIPECRKKKIATALLNESLKDIRKNIYLYTIIPEFFKKFGFQVTSSPPTTLPSKIRYECEYCHPEKCVCMCLAGKVK